MGEVYAFCTTLILGAQCPERRVVRQVEYLETVDRNIHILQFIAFRIHNLHIRHIFEYAAKADNLHICSLKSCEICEIVCMQGAIAEAVGTELILHIIVESLAHCLTQSNVILAQSLKIPVFILIIKGPYFHALIVSDDYHICSMDILRPIFPLIPFCKPPSVEHTYCNLAACPALRDAHAKECNLALIGLCKTYSKENILHITARYVYLSQFLIGIGVVTDLNSQLRVVRQVNLNE